MSASTYEELKTHIGHNVGVHSYGDNARNVAVECNDCFETLLDFDKPDDTNTFDPRAGLHIEGRRWFQKSFGNTYHSVRIWSDNTLLKTLPYQYGYGDQYLQTALDWLKANGYAPADAPYGTLYLRETLHITWEVSDVPRQKDL